MFFSSSVAFEEAGGIVLFCGVVEFVRRLGRGVVVGSGGYGVKRKDR